MLGWVWQEGFELPDVAGDSIAAEAPPADTLEDEY
jgi:hypothetical protein